MKIILCPNPFRDKGLKAARSTERLLSAAGVHTEYCFPFPVEKSNIGEIDPAIKIKEMKTELPDADFLVCFGGDGTILHAAKDASSFGVPIVGVNMGSVGFMAELEQGDASSADPSDQRGVQPGKSDAPGRAGHSGGAGDLSKHRTQ